MIYNAKKIVKELFTDNEIPLLFTWYNDKCTEYSKESFLARYPEFNTEIDKDSIVDENKELSINPHSNRLDLERIPDQLVLPSQVISSFPSFSSSASTSSSILYSSSSSSSSSDQNKSNRLTSQVEEGESELFSPSCNNLLSVRKQSSIEKYIENIEKIIMRDNHSKYVKSNPLRTILVKPLISVWKSFPDYSELNTVIPFSNCFLYFYHRLSAHFIYNYYHVYYISSYFLLVFFFSLRCFILILFLFSNRQLSFFTSFLSLSSSSSSSSSSFQRF